MAAPKTIIFGPTGGVGSAAALSALAHGAQVSLAMRNTSKPIPGLSLQNEQSLNFTRVQADLTDPSSVKDAVTKTGATRAFVYLAFTSGDGMRSTLESLRAGGVEYVVFLSSWSVQGNDISTIPPEEIIPHAHAQVEINLEKVFGSKGFVAVRPRYFASNSQWWARGVPEGEVKMMLPGAKFDWIAPADIGRVCGAFLVGGLGWQGNQKNFVYLCGPEDLAQEGAVAIVGRVLGKEIKVTELDEQGAVAEFMKSDVPEPVARYLVKALKKEAEIAKDTKTLKVELDAVDNIEKYTGRKQSMGFKEFVEQNKEIFI